VNKFYNLYWARRLEGEKRGDVFNERRHFRLKFAKINQYIPKDKGTIIVDFGCGDGKAINEMSVINPSARYIGLDVSDIAVSEASISNPKGEFHKIVDGEKVPLGDSSVDFVICSEVIEHVYDVENTLSEICRILKLGGRLLITTPYHGFIKNLLIVFFNFDNHFNPTGPHIRFFSKKSFLFCITKLGFRPLINGYFGRFYPVPHCIFVLAEKTNDYAKDACNLSR
jgi:ubiquinone/menaquinone biosynthesis C-methylase UbiE